MHTFKEEKNMIYEIKSRCSLRNSNETFPSYCHGGWVGAPITHYANWQKLDFHSLTGSDRRIITKQNAV